MKHLKIFESFADDRFELFEDFCNDSLSYLIDDEYVLSINKVLEPKRGKQLIGIKLTNPTKRFNWNDISGDFIPFLQLLNDKYTILAWYGNYNEDNPQINIEFTQFEDQFDVEKIISETCHINYDILSIKIRVII